MSKRSSQIAILIALMTAGMLPVWAASSRTGISGVVRDSRGTPQMGALVELLAPDSAVVAQVYTNLRGGFAFEHIFPGTYQMKATGASFLPTLRENLQVRANRKIVVDLTLNTLFEAIQWLPAEPRSPDEPSDDWKWTLRSSSNRPLLRFLEDGPLVVVTDGSSQSSPQLEARIAVSSPSHDFGQSAPHNAFEVERAGSGGGHLILRADISTQPLKEAQYAVGYEQPLGPGREIRTFVAAQHTGGIEGAGGSRSFDTVIFRGAESVDFGPNISAEFGNQIESVRGPNEVVSSSPFAAVSWHSGGSRVSYSVSTSPMVQSADQIADSGTLAPQFSEVDGTLRVQHGLHQELRVEDDEARLRALIAFYQDQVENPTIDGGGVPVAQDFAGGNLLYDPVGQVIRAAGPNYSATGFRTTVERRFGDSTWASFSYADGTALVLPVSESATTTVSQALSSLSARRSQAVTGRLSGTLVRTGTYWRASYRWQPAATVTPVAVYDNMAQDAFLSLLVRQPIHCGHLLPNGTEALVAVRNLLAEGYRPFLTADGSTLYFAQASRSIQGGLSFSF